jgi:hypothetical protein
MDILGEAGPCEDCQENKNYVKEAPQTSRINKYNKMLRVLKINGNYEGEAGD